MALGIAVLFYRSLLNMAAIIVNKIHITLLQSPLSPDSILINKLLRHREAKFSAKVSTTTNYHCNIEFGEKGAMDI